MRVECIDDSNRPNDIPTSKWVKKGEKYTVIRAANLQMQNGMLGFQLEEIDLSGCAPYQFFSANRFKPLDEVPTMEEEKADELVEELLEELELA